MTKRNKKYSMRAISSKFSEKGGFTAQFEGDGYSVDAFAEILPDVIDQNGIKVSQGVAKDLIAKFLQACAQKTAATGESVTVEGLLIFNLSIRGWFANKDSKAARDNVRVGIRLLNDLKPTVEFSMTNVNEGDTLALYTVRGDELPLGQVRRGGLVTINGKYLKMLEGDTVVAQCGAATIPLVIEESADDHVTVRLPGDSAESFAAGTEVVFTVTGRCGDAEAGAQVKTIAATLAD